jgi:DNA-binding CsgD family transcriptional regulator
MAPASTAPREQDVTGDASITRREIQETLWLAQTKAEQDISRFRLSWLSCSPRAST